MISPAPCTLHPAPSERLLATIWQRQWLDGRPLMDSLGRMVRVVYPGRRWGGAGPDFQGAVLALGDGTLLRGDVEVHLRAADWRAHGHGRDPAYNRTVLHVVLRAGAGGGERQDGVAVPILELAGRLAAPLPSLAARLAGEPEQGQEELACLGSAEEVIRVVDRAGLERFLEKAASFEADLSVVGADEVLYRATLVALGYSANKEPCARLGELVPWDLVRRLGREADGESRLRGLLLGAAGLLPTQRGLRAEPGEPERAGHLWRALAPELGRRPLGAGAWRLAGVRPENSPTRRLVGGAALLAGWAAGEAATDQLEAILEHRERPAALVARFRARSEEVYWAQHYDFGEPSRGARPWQIGGPRAAEIVVNVLLPLGYAVGRARDRPELAAGALLAYRRLPGGPWNRVTRAMAAQLLGSDGARHCRTAARQQGLLQLFKRWCWERRCGECPAGARRRALGVGAVS